jgi:hypothetical protein
MRIRLLRGLLLGTLASLLCLVPASLAQADVGAQIIHNCEFGTGKLTGFTQADYNQALAEINGSAGEYSDCAGLIREAQVAALRGGGGVGGGAGGSTQVADGGGVTIAGEPTVTRAGHGEAVGTAAALQPTTAQEQQLDAARRGGEELVPIASDGFVSPDSARTRVGSVGNSLPAPLLALLAALLAGGLLGLRGVVTRRVRARRSR